MSLEMPIYIYTFFFFPACQRAQGGYSLGQALGIREDA